MNDILKLYYVRQDCGELFVPSHKIPAGKIQCNSPLNLILTTKSCKEIQNAVQTSYTYRMLKIYAIYSNPIISMAIPTYYSKQGNLHKKNNNFTNFYLNLKKKLKRLRQAFSILIWGGYDSHLPNTYGIYHCNENKHVSKNING